MLNGTWSCQYQQRRHNEGNEDKSEHHYLSQQGESKTRNIAADNIAPILARYKEGGNEAYRKGDYQKAISIFTKAIHLHRCRQINTNTSTSSLHNNTSLATYYSNRAAAYTMISKFKKALKDYDDAILMDPTFIKAILRKAKIYVVMKKYDEARATYLQALELCQRHPSCNESAVGQDSRRSIFSTSSTDSTIDSSLECEIKQKIYEVNQLLLRQVSDATKKINSTLTLKRTDSKRAMKKLRNEKKVEVRKTPSSLSLRRSDSYSRRVEKSLVRKTSGSLSLRRNDSFSRSSDRLRRADSFLRQFVILKLNI
jgi:tetratricopeptide (TPR) repeat protein